MSVILTEKAVKARKKHRCVFCQETIDVGSVYAVRTGVNDGFFTMKMHHECRKFADDNWREDWEEGISEGGAEFTRQEAIAGVWNPSNPNS